MNYIHERALCESADIGEGTHVGAFAHILPGAAVGAQCCICDSVYIDANVVIGRQVTVQCGVQLWGGLRLEDDVYIGPNATFASDTLPQTSQLKAPVLETRICKGASIGANSTILSGVTIGEYAVIGAGTVVAKNIPPYAIVSGNPCRIVGYVGSLDKAASGDQRQSPTGKYEVFPSRVRGVVLHHFPTFTDVRGDLSVGNFPTQVPFAPARYFVVYGVPSSETRGEHAHRVCEQFLLCLHGSVSVVADDGVNREEFVLNKNNIGLYLPPLTWGIQYKNSADAVLLVFASHPYDNGDYIRSYEQFVSVAKQRGSNES